MLAFYQPIQKNDVLGGKKCSEKFEIALSGIINLDFLSK